MHIVFFIVELLACFFLGVHKNVVLMASGVIVLGATDDPTQKLYVINLYNFTMGMSDFFF